MAADKKRKAMWTIDRGRDPKKLRFIRMGATASIPAPAPAPVPAPATHGPPPLPPRPPAPVPAPAKNASCHGPPPLLPPRPPAPSPTPAPATAIGMVATTSSYKGHRRCIMAKNANSHGPPPPQPPKAPVHRVGLLGTLLRINGNRPTCVFKKKLTKSDIDAGQNRLQLPKEDLEKSSLYRLLTPEEKAHVEGGSSDAVKVTVLDRDGQEYTLTFRYYPDKLRQYRFIGPDYRNLVNKNEWQVGHTLELWGFRRRGRGGDGPQGKLVVAMVDCGSEEEEEEKNDVEDDDEEMEETTQPQPQLASDQPCHQARLASLEASDFDPCSGLTPYEWEAMETLALMFKEAASTRINSFAH